MFRTMPIFSRLSFVYVELGRYYMWWIVELRIFCSDISDVISTRRYVLYSTYTLQLTHIDFFGCMKTKHQSQIITVVLEI